MRWPFGPPHLTLKPSNKKLQKNKKENKKKKQTKNKKKEKKEKKEKKRSPPKKKQQKHQKIAFQLSVKFFLFWVAFQNFPFLTSWPGKRAPRKHYKNRGFRAFFFGKQLCVTKRPFWTKKPKIYKFQLSFCLPIFFSFNNQKHKNLLKPPFL